MTTLEVNKCLLSIYYVLFLGAIVGKAFPQDEDYENSVDFGAPLILPYEPSIVLEVHTDYILRCEDKEPIEWKWDDEYELKHEIIEFSTHNTERPYGSELRLFNVTHFNVGYYFCKQTQYAAESEIEALLELANENKASHIYVFINDPSHLLVESNKNSMILAPLDADVIVPCKPTMRNTEVILTTSNNMIYNSSTAHRYNPLQGFVLVLRSITEAGEFTCKPKEPSPLNPYENINILVDIVGNKNNYNLRHNINHTNNNDSNLFAVDNPFLNNTFDYYLEGLLSVYNDTNYEEVIETSSESNFYRVTKRSLHTTPAYKFKSAYNRLSTPRSKSTHINKPSIKSESRGHVIENDNFTLVCELEIDYDISFEAKWDTPHKLDPKRVFKSRPTYVAGMGVGQSTLTVFNAQKTDSGQYKCIVTDHSDNTAHTFYTMTVLATNESYINMNEPANYYNIIERANKKIIINVNYRGYPFPTLKWYEPNNSEITSGHKFDVSSTDSTITLEIKNTQMTDSGIYKVIGANGYVHKTLEFNVTVKDVPIAIVGNIKVQVGAEAQAICNILAYPSPKVFWTFTSCSIHPRWPNCDTKPVFMKNSTETSIGPRIVDYKHYLRFTPKTPGILRCMAENSEGKGNDAIAEVFLADIKDNMTVFGINENTTIARGDHIEVTCAALAYHYTDELYWYKDQELVEADKDIEILTERTNYSYKKILRFKSIKNEHQGSYECRATPISDDHQKETKSIDIFVHEPSSPVMLQTNLIAENDINLKLGNPLELDCEATGIPRPNVHWFKDNIEINTTESQNIEILNRNSKLIVHHIMPGDQGVYKCIVANRLGEVEASVQVLIVDLPGISMAWIMGIVSFIALLILLVIYLIVRVRRERRLLKKLKAAGLENFEEGDLEHLNPALTLDEQADLLPYDRNFEFPREKLKLGKQLGSGAFGVVLKAYAEGIKPDEKESVVAVKMVKTSDDEVKRALVSELKVMVHLGQHLNVVNLLGAVTTNIVKRDFMVIVEYCRFGNVQNVLLRNRKNFIDQINPQTDKIDPNYVCKRIMDGSESNRNGLKYVNLTFDKPHYINELKLHLNNNYTVQNRSNSENDPRSGTRAGRLNSNGYRNQNDLYEGKVDSCHTVMTTIPDDDNSSQPVWRSNYTHDSNESMSISTSDLVSWAFQVARGMDYLSSKRVLHGDLAARNILLCEDNVVKICDFGLARTMYNSNNYKKQGVGKLPIKWLALESLSDQVFSTNTDVWSYGIVLWEFFSLAKVPYPGMVANDMLYLKLKDGYRMEKPPFANSEIYDIMLECWSADPDCRPLFNVLEKRFAHMLGDDVTNHYMDLDEPYLRSNIDWAAKRDIYLHTHPGSPTEIAPAPPGYVNGRLLPEIRIDSSSDDYLNMNTDTEAVIYNPKRFIDKDNTTTANNMSSFVFSDPQHSPTLKNNLDSPSKKNLKKGGLEPEEIPMLEQHHNDDNVREYKDDVEKGVMPVPMPRQSSAETRQNGDNNYVNLKQKNYNGRSTDAFSNPNYQPIRQQQNK